MNDKEYQHITAWQTKHDEKDDIRFAALEDLVKAVPKTEDIERVVAGAVKVTVNGKIDDIKTHLNTQDADMKWIKWFVMGISGGIGLIVVSLIANKL